MTTDPLAPEKAKANAKILEYAKAQGWKAVESTLYGLRITDPRCDYSGVSVMVCGNGGGAWNRRATDVKLIIDGPPRRQSYLAPSCAQFKWATILARLDRAVATATASYLNSVKADAENKRLKAQAEKEAPLPKLHHDTSLERVLQPEGQYQGGKYKVRLDTYLDASQLNALTVLLAEWKKP